MGYTKDAIKGISWLGAERLFLRGGSIFRIAILARLLTPVQFGIFGIASLVLAIIEIFTDTGINILLIQNKENTQEYINTAWFVSIVRGVIIALCVIFSAGFISRFFNTPEAYSLILLISIVPLIRGFINPSVAKFTKDLDFHKDFYYRSSVFIVEALISIALIYVYRSPEGLIFGLAAAALFEVIISFFIAKPTPNLSFHFDLFSNIIRRGKWMTLSGIFNYLYQNVDNMVVAKILGTGPLGLYNMAYKISLVPLSEVGDVLSRSTLPVYVKIADDRERLRRAFLKTLRITLLGVIPIGIILFLFPEQIINLVLGDQWISAAPVLKILAFLGVVRAVIYTMTNLLISVHRQDIVTFLSFIDFIAILIFIIPFTRIYGIEGAAVSAFIGAIASLPFCIYFVWKQFKTK